MRLPLQIASRFLRYNKVQTIMIALGIAVGVSVQVFIGLLIQGLQDGLVDTTIGNASHITIQSETGEIDNYQNIIDDINMKESITAITPTISGNGFLQTEASSEPIFIRGFDIEAAEGIYEYRERLVDGRLPNEPSEVIIGVGLAELLSLETGDDTEIFLPDGTLKSVTVVGLMDFNVAAINDSWVVSDLTTASDLFGYDNAVSAIEIQVEAVFEADVIAGTISTVVGEGYEITNWKDQNEELLSGLNGQSISSLMIQIFVLVAVILGIASVLAITVIQKSRQIGILKAMGITNKKASLIFLLQGFMLGIIGAALGILLGLGLSYAFATFALNPDGTPVIPLTIDYNFIAVSGVIAVMAAMLASIIPARRSSKLSTIEVIKNG